MVVRTVAVAVVCFAACGRVGLDQPELNDTDGGGAGGVLDAPRAADAGDQDMQPAALIGQQCREVSQRELARAGCPLLPPPRDAPCAGSGYACPYDLESSARGVRQLVVVCEARPASNTFAWTWTWRTCSSTCDYLNRYFVLLSALAQACDPMPFTSCDPPPVAVVPTHQERVNRVFQAVLEACSDGPILTGFYLELANGCPARLIWDNSDEPARPSASFVNCLIAALTKVRWACAVDVTCARYEPPCMCP